jgi:NAD(P)-dependent dehydrogenase (short-subunit alcohol dehydrogenase family)
VVVNDASQTHARTTADDIDAAGGSAEAVPCDIGDPITAEALVADTHARHGRLDILLNNAGRGGPTGPIDRVDDDQLDMIVGTHLIGSFRTARAAWPIMVEAGYGRILFTASGSALGVVGMPAYSMAKAGLWGLTRALALDGAGHGIKVNALAPVGYTRAAALNPHEDTRRVMEEHFPPGLNTPAALLLVHEVAPCTGELVSTGGGRVAVIGTYGVPGFETEEPLTPESVLEHWDEVTDTSAARRLVQSRDDLAFSRFWRPVGSDPSDEI